MTGEKRDMPNLFAAWVDSMLAGTQWSAAGLSRIMGRAGDDLAASALADGFAAAALGVAHDGGSGQ